MFCRLKDITVLYVEDEIDVLEEIVEMLEIKIKKLYTASNGQEGLELYKKYKDIDIIISDIKMPIMDGMSMIENIREFDKEVPVVITTAFNEISFLKHAIDLHVDKYITKPIDFSQLLSVTNRACEVIFQKKELIQKNIMLLNKEKLEVMRELVENIAHQWRQPLSVISTAVSGMQIQKEHGILTDDIFYKSCEVTNQNVQELSKTIDHFREFLSDDEEKVEISLKGIINICCEIIGDSYKEKSINIYKNIEDINIVGVKSYLIQIILTILSNAKDILLTKEESNRYVFIDIKKENDKVLVTIKDNGGGLKQEYISKVFEPYFTTKHKSQGRGLALYSVYQLIENSFNGTIEASNKRFQYEDIEYFGAEFKIAFNTPVKEN